MATLVRWDPLREAAAMHTELSRLMNGLLEGNGLEGNGRQTQAWVPTMDVWETEDGVHYAFDLPGVTEEAIDVEVEDGNLTVSATRERTTKENGKFHRFERRFGTFSRTIGLPQGVSEDAIKASYTGGVLEIAVPKPEQQKPKRIEVAVEGTRPTIEGTTS
ncbi:MAG: Hsp20/alpha crystallin family protein [Gaiellaceae bacterium]